MDTSRLVREIAEALRGRGAAERAVHDRTYLKSELLHCGASVPAIRAVAKGVASTYPMLSHDEVIALATAQWAAPVYERRVMAVELLDGYGDTLGPADGLVIEGLLRDAGHGHLSMDSPFTLLGASRSAITNLAPCLTAGLATVTCGSVAPRCWRCSLHCVEDKETSSASRDMRMRCSMTRSSSFARLGWVLRDTAKKRPDLVYSWLLPRASRASGVTIREAVKPLSTQQRDAVLAAR